MASFLTTEVSITFNGEHGKFVIREFIDTKSPSCVFTMTCLLCERKNCDEYLCFICHCWGCHNDDYVCKECSLTTHLFTHLCKCFRQTTHHLWYNLKMVWEKIEGIIHFIHHVIEYTSQPHLL